MPSVTAPRKAKQTEDRRVVVPISSSDKRLIEEAAALTGQSIGAFIIAQARTAASELLEHSVIRLNVEESRRLVKALLAPPRPPNAAMKRAFKKYRETIISDVNPNSPALLAKLASTKKSAGR